MVSGGLISTADLMFRLIRSTEPHPLAPSLYANVPMVQARHMLLGYETSHGGAPAHVAHVYQISDHGQGSDSHRTVRCKVCNKEHRKGSRFCGVKCAHCNIKGHKEAQCRKKQRALQQQQANRAVTASLPKPRAFAVEEKEESQRRESFSPSMLTPTGGTFSSKFGVFGDGQ